MKYHDPIQFCSAAFLSSSLLNSVAISGKAFVNFMLPLLVVMTGHPLRLNIAQSVTYITGKASRLKGIKFISRRVLGMLARVQGRYALPMGSGKKHLHIS